MWRWSGYKEVSREQDELKSLGHRDARCGNMHSKIHGLDLFDIFLSI
jgi:hypothetical protein